MADFVPPGTGDYMSPPVKTPTTFAELAQYVFEHIVRDNPRKITYWNVQCEVGQWSGNSKVHVTFRVTLSFENPDEHVMEEGPTVGAVYHRIKGYAINAPAELAEPVSAGALLHLKSVIETATHQKKEEE